MSAHSLANGFPCLDPPGVLQRLFERLPQTQGLPFVEIVYVIVGSVTDNLMRRLRSQIHHEKAPARSVASTPPSMAPILRPPARHWKPR